MSSPIKKLTAKEIVCNVEIFYKNGIRESHKYISLLKAKELRKQNNVVLSLVAYKTNDSEDQFLHSHLGIYDKNKNGSFNYDYETFSCECDDPIYLFAQKKMRETQAWEQACEEQSNWKNTDGEYVSPLSQAALE